MLALLPHRAAGRAVHARQPAAQLAQLPVGEVRAGSVCLRQCGAQLLLGGLPGSVNALGSLDWLLSSHDAYCVGTGQQRRSRSCLLMSCPGHA